MIHHRECVDFARLIAEWFDRGIMSFVVIRVAIDSEWFLHSENIA